MSLQKRRILVVRPQLLDGWGEDQFIEQLVAAGADALHYPVMAIEPFTVPHSADFPTPERELIKTRVLDLANYSFAIFVSRPAAHLGADWIDHYWPQLPLGVRFYAVGSSTAEVLSGTGIDAISPTGDMSSEGLLELPELQQFGQQKILIFRGCGGRELLADTLRQRGAEVDYAELYRRRAFSGCKQQICTALEQGVDALVVHSGEMMQALLALLPAPLKAKLQTVPILVPGKRLESLAKEASFSQVVVSPNASPQSMVSTLGRWYS